MPTRRALLCSLSLLPLAPRAWACGWDRDTLRDEIQATPSIFDLVVAQLPRHSEAWYLRNVEVANRALVVDPGDLPATDDLAVALAHLDRLDEASVVLTRVLARHPGRYETLSNLGVVRKKQGRLDEAAHHIAEALALRPEGHLGVGDWYLHACRWRARRLPEDSFLGVPYAAVLANAEDGAYAAWELESHLALALDPGRQQERESTKPYGFFGDPDPGFDRDPLAEDYDRDWGRLLQLLRYDRTFADGLLVLGDELALRHDFSLAHLAWLRARSLGHPRPDLLGARIERIRQHWQGAGGDNPLDPEGAQALLSLAESRAREWVGRFQQTEARLLGRGERPTFREVEHAMERQGIHRWRASDLPLGRSTLPPASLRDPRRRASESAKIQITEPAEPLP